MMIGILTDWKTQIFTAFGSAGIAGEGAGNAISGSGALYDWLSLGVAALGVAVGLASLAFRVYTWKKKQKALLVKAEGGGVDQPPKGP